MKRVNEIKTEWEYSGWYRSFEIAIEKNESRDGFYIQIRSPDGCLVWDGFWGDGLHTMTDAIKMAKRCCGKY